MKRTFEQIKEHYEIEKVLANRLKLSNREERRCLYSSVYNEMFRKVPLHPQLTRKKNFIVTKLNVFCQMLFLKRFLKKNMIFAEIGAGDCSLSFAVCKNVKKVYAVDVSEEITKNSLPPENFQLILSDGQTIPLPDDSVHVVYSNQLMEHLHPDDAIEQLHNVKNVLTTGGKYICMTPNRINGPHDISKYFEKEASGFHLKEYTFAELNHLFKKIGFISVFGYIGAKVIYVKTPIFLILKFERLIKLLPHSIKRYAIFKPFLSIKIVGIK
jgi:ubiquinone/menaquinone biosynthesis C-methylase UbiE